jgi:ribosomal-protein-serine acetyltransferase
MNPFLINLPSVMRTPRLFLRPITPQDGNIIYDYKKESWKELDEWMMWNHPPSIDKRLPYDDELFCQYRYNRLMERKDLTFLAFCKNTYLLIGIGSLTQCDWRAGTFNLSYSVRTTQTQKGYAKEIALTLIQYAFKALFAKKVLAFHGEGNVGSEKVLNYLGFKKLYILANEHILNNKTVDEHHYCRKNLKNIPPFSVTW